MWAVFCWINVRFKIVSLLLLPDAKVSLSGIILCAGLEFRSLQDQYPQLDIFVHSIPKISQSGFESKRNSPPDCYSRRYAKVSLSGDILCAGLESHASFHSFLETLGFPTLRCLPTRGEPFLPDPLLFESNPCQK